MRIDPQITQITQIKCLTPQYHFPKLPPVKFAALVFCEELNGAGGVNKGAKALSLKN